MSRPTRSHALERIIPFEISSSTQPPVFNGSAEAESDAAAESVQSNLARARAHSSSSDEDGDLRETYENVAWVVAAVLLVAIAILVASCV